MEDRRALKEIIIKGRKGLQLLLEAAAIATTEIPSSTRHLLCPWLHQGVHHRL